MSLRFLKAKPKLTLSKDKKVRSATKAEESICNVKEETIEKSCIVQANANEHIKEGREGNNVQNTSILIEEESNVQLKSKEIKDIQEKKDTKRENEILDTAPHVSVKCNVDLKVKNNSPEVENNTNNSTLLTKPNKDPTQSHQSFKSSTNISDLTVKKPLYSSTSSSQNNVASKNVVPIVTIDNVVYEKSKIISSEYAIQHETKKDLIQKSSVPNKRQKGTASEKITSSQENSGPKSSSTTNSLSSYIKKLEGEKQQLLTKRKLGPKSRHKLEIKVESMDTKHGENELAISKKSPHKNLESIQVPITLFDKEHNDKTVSPPCSKKNTKTAQPTEKLCYSTANTAKQHDSPLEKENLIESTIKGDKDNSLILKSAPCDDKKSKVTPTAKKNKNVVCSSDSKPFSHKNSHLSHHKDKGVLENILSNGKIKSIPVMLPNPIVIIDEKDISCMQKDHMYAKLTNVVNASSNYDIGNLNKSEIASVKLENLDHDQEIQKKLLNSSKVSEFNAFRRDLIMEDDEASESEGRLVIDINACTYNREDGQEAIHDTSYPFHDKELKEFSGLSLVTQIIKDENIDPLHYNNQEAAPFCTADHNTYEEKVIYSENIIDLIDVDTNDSSHRENVEFKHFPIENKNHRRRKCVSFNLKEDNNYSQLEINQDDIELSNTPKKKRIKRERVFKKEDFSESQIKTNHPTVTETVDLEEADIKDLKRTIKIKKDDDYEYMPDEEVLDITSDLEIDEDEIEFVIHGKKIKGVKKKTSESVYLKRQLETMKKINSQTSWKENLTVSDLIFYNPESNPMTNPPDIAVVKKNEVVLEGNTDKVEAVSEDEEAVDNPEPVPQLKISADGKLIIDPKSLIIEETGLKKSKERLQHSDALVESKYTIKKFDNLYSKRKMKRQACEWAPEDTIMFYRAVNTIGTDFSMMATLFENRTRADIKRKYKLEERKNPSLLSRALRNYNNFDIEELKSELSADRRRAEKIKEDEKERKRLIKEEKKQKKQAKPKVGKTSLCGKLIQNSTEKKSKIPAYVKPHFLNTELDIQVCS